MEVVSNVHVSVLEVSHKFVYVDLLNLDSGQGQFFVLVFRKLLLPQLEEVQDSLPDHVESRVTEGGLILLKS